MASRGRPVLPAATVNRTFCRFVELYAGGMGITAAELAMTEEGEWRPLNSRQAIRKRRVKGEFNAFLATVMLAYLSYMISGKT